MYSRQKSWNLTVYLLYQINTFNIKWLRPAIFMIRFKGFKLSPRWRNIVMQMVTAFSTLVRKQSNKTVEVGKKWFDSQFRVHGGVKIKHSSIRIVRYPFEYLIIRLLPNIWNPIIRRFHFFPISSYHHPFDHESFEY